MRKTMTEEEYEVMRKAVETDTPMDRKYLENTFKKAMQGFRKISEDIWRVEVIREYFWHRHEENLSKDLPPMVKRLCLVREGTLVKQFGKAFKVVFEDGETRIITPLYKDAKVGDKVMVHYGHAAEKV
ncbi:hypothetical protein GF371_00460 [Candidatus Woesearchaeota archaeon]|nr:hypothetical protein [Candidatus Woesearchaeota archaeon]